MYSKRFRKTLLLVGDLILFYLGLFFTLTFRYGSLPSEELWKLHQWPFLFVYLIWVVIFYIAGLYDIEKFISFSELRNRILKTMAAAGVVAVLLFYLTHLFGITPKTNLFINVLFSALFVWLWRRIFFGIALKSSKTKILFLDDDVKEIGGFKEFLSQRPHFGYTSVKEIDVADIIVVPEQIRQDQKIVQALYEMTLSGKTIVSFDKFYESITGRIPVSLISEAWFLENLMELNKQTFEKFKRGSDIIFSIILLIILGTLYPFIALAIKINSTGPVFYKQKRVGKNGKNFEIWKFRSMIVDAEKNGARWAKEKDERVTFVGNILRKTRIDELPQIWNVLKGDLSFVGPRPERPEFVKELSEKIPYYSIRHLVKPGLSGWAQINFPYGASVEDAMEKLQYDLFYIKNRSLFLEISILLKTIMILFKHEGR